MIPPRASARKIEDLILRFRSGDREAGEELIAQFRPLIGKYMNLFLRGIFKDTDADVLKFIKCCGFVESESDYGKIARWLKRKLFNVEKEDIEQACKVALLETARNYVNISGTYKFVLLKYIKCLIDDIPTTYIRMEESDILPPYRDKYETDQLDEDWVSGRTAGDGFSLLTRLQRQIVLYTYEKKWPDSYIMQILNLTRTQLEKEKQAIKNTLQEALNIKWVQEE